jgi:predicted nuclease of predicted toxin-antitoxin system
VRVFFDQNVPRRLAQFLTGHEVTRAAELGWEELKNGELLAQAELHGFDVFISCDRNLAYQQRVEDRKIAIVGLSTNNWPVMKEYTERIAQALNEAAPGRFRSVDCGTFAPRRK